MVNSVDSDEMACDKPSHLDLHCLHRYWLLSVRLKGFMKCFILDLNRGLFVSHIQKQKNKKLHHTLL